MDSGNSGSLQSSSGGDEEYDSRAESISAFFNTPTPTPTPHHPPPFFDTLSSYLDSSTANPFLNPYPTPHNRNPTSTTTTTTTTNPPPPPQPQQPSTTPPRTSKKRSRASRRAPTTVLTTDTSNFRAMVQEFTGIPNPPFSAVPRPRFDLFRSPADVAQPYILRPFAQKSTANTSSFPHNIIPPPITTTTTTSTNPNNYQNSLLNFQSLLQSANYTTTTTLPAMPTFATRPPASSNYGDLGLVIASEGTQSGWTGEDRSQLRSVMGNYEASQRASGCKLNYSAKDSTSAEKAVESVNSARSEGMMDSWICTSD